MFNQIKTFYNELEKFYLSKILGRKYIRTGKCKACGSCCRNIYIRHGKNVLNDENKFEMLKSQHFFYSYLKVIGKDDTGLVFECTKLDKEKGRCTAYNRRARICRQYPQEGIFMMGGKLSEDCGFKFMPINSFEEVFSKVLKKSERKPDSE